MEKLYAAAQSLEIENTHTRTMLKQINEMIAAKNITIQVIAAKLVVDCIQFGEGDFRQ